MVTIASLWLPILLSAVFVWIASAIVWMALPHHKTDWKPLPDEEALRAALNAQQVGTGQFIVPFAATQAAMKDPEYTRKRREGPVGILTLTPPGVEGMGGKMAGSFVYYLVVGVIVAYLAGRTLEPGTQYLQVFRFVSTTAWLAYAFAIVPESIWFGRPWSTTIKHMLDGLAYALLTAGTFGWLWPSA